MKAELQLPLGGIQFSRNVVFLEPEDMNPAGYIKALEMLATAEAAYQATKKMSPIVLPTTKVGTGSSGSPATVAPSSPIETEVLKTENAQLRKTHEMAQQFYALLQDKYPETYDTIMQSLAENEADMQTNAAVDDKLLDSKEVWAA